MDELLLQLGTVGVDEAGADTPWEFCGDPGYWPYLGRANSLAGSLSAPASTRSGRLPAAARGPDPWGPSRLGEMTTGTGFRRTVTTPNRDVDEHRGFQRSVGA